MVLTKGFELLKTRQIDDPFNVEGLEKDFGIEIPYLYKLFANTFYLVIDNEFANVEGLKMNLSIINIINQNGVVEDFYFDTLFPIEFSMSTYEDYEFWSEKGYMMIGGGPPEGGILLGLKDDERDAIIYNNGDKYVKLADNIFEFMRRVIVVLNDEDDTRKHLPKLYKKWGDKTWKIQGGQSV